MSRQHLSDYTWPDAADYSDEEDFALATINLQQDDVRHLQDVDAEIQASVAERMLAGQRLVPAIEEANYEYTQSQIQLLDDKIHILELEAQHLKTELNQYLSIWRNQQPEQVTAFETHCAVAQLTITAMSRLLAMFQWFHCPEDVRSTMYHLETLYIRIGEHDFDKHCLETPSETTHHAADLFNDEWWPFLTEGQGWQTPGSEIRDFRPNGFSYFAAPADYSHASRTTVLAAWATRKTRLETAIRRLLDESAAVSDFLIPNQLDLWLDSAIRWIDRSMETENTIPVDSDIQGWQVIRGALFDARSSLVSKLDYLADDELYYQPESLTFEVWDWHAGSADGTTGHIVNLPSESCLLDNHEHQCRLIEAPPPDDDLPMVDEYTDM